MSHCKHPPLFTFIYALTDPRDGMIRYVGKADDPARRYAAHTKEVRQRNPYKEAWIAQLSALGLQPGLLILEQVSMSDWSERERFWITHHRGLGSRLTNLCEGGRGGCPPGRKMSEEHKEHLAASNRGKKRSPEVLAKLSERMRGRKLTDEHRAKISAANKGKSRPPEVVAKIVASRARWTPTEETRRKMGDIQRGRPRSEATKAKISASTKGIPKTAEMRARLSVSQKGIKPSAEARAKMRDSWKTRVT